MFVVCCLLLFVVCCLLFVVVCCLFVVVICCCLWLFVVVCLFDCVYVVNTASGDQLTRGVPGWVPFTLIVGVSGIVYACSRAFCSDSRALSCQLFQGPRKNQALVLEPKPEFTVFSCL